MDRRCGSMHPGRQRLDLIPECPTSLRFVSLSLSHYDYARMVGCCFPWAIGQLLR